MVPNSAVSAHHWAANAFTNVLVPDHAGVTSFGHAQALTLAVVPVLSWCTRSIRDADPVAFFS